MFDPYHKWFGIPLKDQPPHHYRLLGLEPFESDLDVIEASADRLMQFVRQYQSGEQAVAAARILNELANARLCLLKPAAKAAYDARLKNEIAAPDSPAELQKFVFAETPTSAWKQKQKATGFPPRVLLLGGAGIVACLGLVLFLINDLGTKPRNHQTSIDNRKVDSISPLVVTSKAAATPHNEVKTPSASPSNDPLPIQLKWNFQGQRPQELQPRADMFPNTFEQVAEGLKITRPEDPAQTAEPVGFVWNGSLQGDFEVTLGFQDFESNTDKTDGNPPRFELHMSVGPPNSTLTNSALIGQHQRSGELATVSGLGERDTAGNHTWRVTELPAEQNAGRLRLVRTGSTIQALAAPPRSGDFLSVGKQVVGGEEITTIKIAIRSESKKSSAKITLNEFSIRGRKASNN